MGQQLCHCHWQIVPQMLKMPWCRNFFVLKMRPFRTKYALFRDKLLWAFLLLLRLKMIGENGQLFANGIGQISRGFVPGNNTIPLGENVRAE